MRQRLTAVLCIVSIGIAAVVVWRWPDLVSMYHSYQMARARANVFGEPTQTGSLGMQTFDEDAWATYENHRSRLIELGEIVEIAYVFRHVEYPTPQASHFFRVLQEDDTHPEFIDWISDQNTEVVAPMNLTVWCKPANEQEWRQYFEERDVSDYDTRLMNSELDQH